MARGHRRDSAIWLGLLTLALLLSSSPAMAEVCDKVMGEHWRGDSWVPLLTTAIELAAAAGGFVLVTILRASWLAYLAATFVLLRALLIVGFMSEADIYRAAVSEGCASLQADQVHVGLFIIFAVAYVWLGYRVRGRHAEAI